MSPGGWALAIAYEDSNAPMRNLTGFEGFKFVLANGPPVDLPLPRMSPWAFCVYTTL